MLKNPIDTLSLQDVNDKILKNNSHDVSNREKELI